MKELNINSEINDLKVILKKLPNIRWNISEKDKNGNFMYFGDELDNWQHEEEDDLAEYFSRIFDTIKELKDKIESL